jgi:hypothetical protein
LIERRTFGLDRILYFDIQGWITLLLGGLLALITLSSSYSHVQIPFVGAVALDQQIGVLLLADLVLALFGDAELATRFDYELREIENEQSEREYEKRMQQLESEYAQLRRDDEQMKLVHEQRMKQLKSETRGSPS